MPSPLAPRPVEIRNAHRRLRFSRQAVAAAVAVLDTHAATFRGGCPPGELSIVFLTDPALAKIHADFMRNPAVTDVITFAGNATAGLAGEICISADMAARYVGLPPPDKLGAHRSRPARRQAPALQEEFSMELTLYLIHGWLHLAGYDDLQAGKKRLMRAAEKRAMAWLRKEKALPVFHLA